MFFELPVNGIHRPVLLSTAQYQILGVNNIDG